jgi:NAD(P)-dependent dehydrogenase (short-subunit alcohol dehydrogenase family)
LLKKKIAFVTGGSSGIGLATAKRFVEEGAYVFIAGRRQAELDKAVAEIGKNAHQRRARALRSPFPPPCTLVVRKIIRGPCSGPS